MHTRLYIGQIAQLISLRPNVAWGRSQPDQCIWGHMIYYMGRNRYLQMMKATCCRVQRLLAGSTLAVHTNCPSRIVAESLAMSAANPPPTTVTALLQPRLSKAVQAHLCGWQLAPTSCAAMTAHNLPHTSLILVMFAYAHSTTFCRLNSRGPDTLLAPGLAGVLGLAAAAAEVLLLPASSSS